MNTPKKIVVIGGTGLIGSRLVKKLQLAGHTVLAASPGNGVDAVTGVGLDDALVDADTVVDVTNPRSFSEQDVMTFFEASGKNLLAAEKRAGVKHHVVLSIVGIDRMPGNGYFKGKVLQEDLVKASGVAYSIVRSTQFFEFLGGIADLATVDGHVRLSGGKFQPIAADDVVAVLAATAAADPLEGKFEIAGPHRAPFDETIRLYLELVADNRRVVRDPEAKYFGGLVEESTLVPLGDASLGSTELAGWVQTNKEAA